MWNRKELKARARKLLSKNYWTAIVICFLVALLTGEYGTSIIKTIEEESITPYYIENQEEREIYTDEDYQRINRIEEKINSLPETQMKLIETAKSNIVSAIKAQIYIIRTADAVRSFNRNRQDLGIKISVLAILSLLFTIIIADPLIVAGKRAFIKIREEDTKVSVIWDIYKKENLPNIAITMCLRNVFNALWYLTIIGGFIKMYEYKMIPYILAENPQIKTREAFKLSKEMMKGNKWKTFLLDLSFLGWHILSIFTFGLLNLFYANPYRTATMVELYTELKGKEEDKMIEPQTKKDEEIVVI